MIKKIALGLTLVTTLSMAQKEALIVGVGNYQGKRSDLNGVYKDIGNMRQLFEQWGFHVTTLKDADSLSLPNKLQEYQSLGREDQFIFYYSGHGYHVKDESGDEADGEDETIVLSDGESNSLFIDDELNGFLNQINAKKLILMDSCHSGTAFKAFGDIKPKSLPNDSAYKVIHSKSFRPRESELNGDRYIALTAAQDNEESLDTSTGGLFTNSFLSSIRNGGADKPLANIRQEMESTILSFCQKSDNTPHHPLLSASNNTLKYGSINQFLKSATPTPPPVVKPKVNFEVLGKKTFNEGELLSFKIDTHGNSGYLTIFSIEEGRPFIMAQTQKRVSGILNFQQDFNITPPIECYKSCQNCQKEVSSVYIILSDKPLNTQKIESKGLKIVNATNQTMRAFRQKTDEAFEPVGRKVEFTIY